MAGIVGLVWFNSSRRFIHNLHSPKVNRDGMPYQADDAGLIRGCRGMAPKVFFNYEAFDFLDAL